MPVLCPSCGTVGHDADRTCAACGTDLADDPVALVPPELATPPPRRTESPAISGRERRTRVAVIALVALVAVAGGITGLVLSRGSSSPSTAWTTVRVRVPTLEVPAAVRVAGLGPHGELRIADLATGRVRELRRHGDAVRATDVLTRGDAIVVTERDGRVEALHDLDRGAPRVTPLGRADAVVPASDPGRVWIEQGARLAQITVGGRTTSRVTLPSGYRVAGGALDDDALLLASTTDATSIVWSPSRHSVVTGTRNAPAFGAAAGTVITSACNPPLNTCRAYASDLRARTMLPLDAPVWDGFEPPVVVGRVSPDGRLAAFGEAFPGHHDVRASITIVDTLSGRVAWTHEVSLSSSAPTAWDARGDLLFFTDGRTAFVHHVDGPEGNLFSLGPVRELQPLAVLPRRVPATAGVARG